MFIKQAFAQTTDAVSIMSQGGDMGSMFHSMLPLFLILAVFYMFIIRPQNKRVAEHKLMISNLKKGDKVVTSGGIIGKVKKVVNDAELVVEVSEGVDINIMRSSIVSLKTLENVNSK